jgi:uncharacterized membrane protein YdbT with pleckstrin-like domain
MSRPLEPEDPHVPADIMQKYEESKKQFPQLNLTEGEYVISAVKRHPIGVVKIWAIGAIIVAALMALAFFILSSFKQSATSSYDGNLTMAVTVGVALLAFMVILGVFVATYIYNSNRFYLTNESVIQEIQTGLFAKHEQTVSLANIEDASYKQLGILPSMFNYGSIRLSTEGEETTYRFNYVTDPKQQIATLNNAVEAFKMGRPVR